LSFFQHVNRVAQPDDVHSSRWSKIKRLFAQAGFPVLSDDVAALTESAGRFLASPSNLKTKLWPDSVTAIYGDIDLPRLDPESDEES
jgi:hypothetical protein